MALPAPPCGVKLEKHQLGIPVHPHPAALSITLVWCFLVPSQFPFLQFQVDGEWRTWIDYRRFQELVREYEQSGGSRTFTAAEYTARTPSWALFGARERGFDPSDVRFQRKNKARDISGC